MFVCVSFFKRLSRCVAAKFWLLINPSEASNDTVSEYSFWVSRRKTKSLQSFVFSFNIFCGGFFLLRKNWIELHFILVVLQKQKVCNGTTHYKIYNTTLFFIYIYIYRNVLYFLLNKTIIKKNYIRAKVADVLEEIQRHPTLVTVCSATYWKKDTLKERFRSFKLSLRTMQSSEGVLVFLAISLDTLMTC